MVGVPARQIGWMSQYGEQIDLPLEGKGEYCCPHTNDVYKLFGDEIEKILEWWNFQRFKSTKILINLYLIKY